jgi:predicted ATPase/transcriptional regulator with XRE-family HTH domain
MSDRDSLSTLLKRYRAAAGQSQEALAAHAGLSTRAISDLERGAHRTPHPATLERLASALALTPSERARLVAAARPDLAHVVGADHDELAREAASSAPFATSAPPLPATPLVGRERDRERGHTCLRPDGARVVTISGPSGVGKTRLALTLAHDLTSTFAHGAAFVDLVPVRDAALVPVAVAQALDARDQLNRVPADQVIAALGGASLLLVLDNFEHVVAAAPFVADLVAACPNVRVLVTSRAPLRIRAERILPLAPLARADAVALFRERARALRPDREYVDHDVAALCARLDDLPLAIELAAAQVRLLGPAEILRHLRDHLALPLDGARDLPPHQRTLNDAIGWSYHLLDDIGRRLFRALGVFVGACALDAALAVLADDGTIIPDTAPRAMAELVDASLVESVPDANKTSRVRMLETTRAYARDQLRLAGEEDDCRRRHAQYYAHLADTVSARGPDAALTDADLANARAAMEWAEEREDATTGLRLAGMTRLWHVRGQIGEAVRWTERMLNLDSGVAARGGPAAPTALRVTRLYGLGRALLGTGLLERAEAWAYAAVRLAESSDDESGLANAYSTVGMIAQAAGRLDDAEAAYVATHAHARRGGDGTLEYRAHYFLGELAHVRGDLPRAAAGYAEALAGASEAEEQWDIAIFTTRLGQVARDQGHYSEAQMYFRSALARLREFASPTWTAWCVEGFAATLSAEGWHREAVRLCAAAATLRERARGPLPPAERVAFEATLAAAQHALGAAAFHAEWANGSAARTTNEVIADALALAACPALEPPPATRDQPESAARLEPVTRPRRQEKRMARERRA